MDGFLIKTVLRSFVNLSDKSFVIRSIAIKVFYQTQESKKLNSYWLDVTNHSWVLIAISLDDHDSTALLW